MAKKVARQDCVDCRKRVDDYVAVLRSPAFEGHGGSPGEVLDAMQDNYDDGFHICRQRVGQLRRKGTR